MLCVVVVVIATAALLEAHFVNYIKQKGNFTLSSYE